MTRRAGFTLVELVVVILILGILAGVAAPKMFNTSAKATDNGLKQTLAIVRDAIEMYSANKGGALPAFAGFSTSVAPYIRGPFPKCPVGPQAGAATIVAGSDGVATPTTGWMYDATTGQFICAFNGASGDGTLYDDF